jgi:hypothetical protein
MLLRARRCARATTSCDCSKDGGGDHGENGSGGDKRERCGRDAPRRAFDLPLAHSDAGRRVEAELR